MLLCKVKEKTLSSEYTEERKDARALLTTIEDPMECLRGVDLGSTLEPRFGSRMMSALAGCLGLCLKQQYDPLSFK